MNGVAPDLKLIFGQAVEIESPTERAAYLDEACGRDSPLRTEVEQLLLAAEQAGSFMDGPAVARDDTQLILSVSERPGTLIGRYKLLQQIGEGGMGVVFMAEQTEPIQRTVALKIIKPGMDSRQVIVRFEAERQALAMMDHTNIARVVDAGATNSGRPYFVMELVKGVPITKYCDEKRLSIRERLELFMPVCQAVQHAHQKGIIHRDIKPNNVLIAEYDGKPIPKIIDFGVAKATAQRLTERTMFTEFGQLIGTFEYMSPEQACFNQLDVDTRSDIYSLGVLLYELLAGSTPLEKERLRSTAFDEIIRVIREEEPPKPSTRLSSLSSCERAIDSLPLAGRVGEGLPSSFASIAANRRTEPARLSREVQGELDWIVMRSLEKDRQRRYQTASAFADDLQRYLTDQPVDACPPSTAYRLKKFIRRNQAGVLAGSAIALALILGLALSTWMFVRERAARVAEAEQRTEAERQRKQAETNERKALSEATRSNQVAHFLKDTLAASGPSVARGRDATLLREILDQTAERVEKELKDQPEVQGELWFTLGSAYEDISDDPRGMGMFRKAAESYRIALGNENPKRALALARYGSMLSMTGIASDGTRNQPRSVVEGKGTTDLAVAIARRCGDPAVLAECLYNRALTSFVAGWSGRTSSKDLPLLRESVALYRKTDGDPVGLVMALTRLGYSTTNLNEGEALAREALALGRDRLPADHPELTHLMSNLAAILLDLGKVDEAEQLLRQAVAMQRKLYAPANAAHKWSRGRMVRALAIRGKWDEADALVRESIAASESNQVSHEFYSVLLVHLLASRGQSQAALDEVTRLKKENPELVYLSWLQCAILLQSGRTDEFRQLCHELLQIRDTPFHVLTARLALVAPMDGADLERACQLAESCANSDYRDIYEGFDIDSSLAQALAQYRQGGYESAVQWSDRAIENKPPSPCGAQAKLIQAMAQSRLSQTESARKALAAADQLLRTPHVDFLSHRTVGELGDWSIAERLRREAGQLLGVSGTPSSADKQPTNNEPSQSDKSTVPKIND